MCFDRASGVCIVHRAIATRPRALVAGNTLDQLYQPSRRGVILDQLRPLCWCDRIVIVIGAQVNITSSDSNTHIAIERAAGWPSDATR